MPDPLVPFRQVHLDFHTSVNCLDVGRDFDRDVFTETVRAGRIRAMNVFARCHHGYSYYPTTVGTPHPNLHVDLLGGQIQALHAAGARAPIYVTLMWDDLAAAQNPGWVIARRDGSLLMRRPLSGESQTAGGYSWSTLDLSSPYSDYVCEQVAELCSTYDPDGFWFDIAFAAPNYSPWGQAAARAAGVNLADDQAMGAFAYARTLSFMERLTALVRERTPHASIVYNHATDGAMRDKVHLQTHLEIESLPTASHQWGYLHYPIVARHARSQGLPFVGMTGRFHKSWGDFGGLKNDDQLTYEIGTILSAGGRVSVGDQLPPSGVLDPATYRLLGRTYARIEALEPWLEGTTAVTDLAILCVGRRVDRGSGILVAERGPGVEGAAQFCLETGIQFDIVDPVPEVLARYRTLIVADGTVLDAAARDAIRSYWAAGGRLVMDGSIALDLDSGVPWLDDLPFEDLGPADTVPAYVRPDARLAAASELADDYDYVLYDGARLVRPLDGSRSHGDVRGALFDRTWEHFTSHAQAPVGRSLHSPLLIATDRLAYVAAPLFRGYLAHDYWAYRELLRAAVSEVVPEPLVRVEGPGWLEVSLLRQAADPALARPGRQIVHLTAYHPRRTASPGPHVDQSWPIPGVRLFVRETGRPVTRAYLAPEGTAVSFGVVDGATQLDLPSLGTHTVVVLE